MYLRQQTAEIIREELLHSDSVLIPEITLQSFLGGKVDFRDVVMRLAEDNNWSVERTDEGNWMFEKKSP